MVELDDQGEFVTTCVYEPLDQGACTYELKASGETLCEFPGNCSNGTCIPEPNCNCPECETCVCCTVPVIGMIEVCVDNLP